MKAPFVIGRALLGGFFLYNGINHFRQADALATYAKAKNVPAPKAGVIATGAMLTVGGASLLWVSNQRWGGGYCWLPCRSVAVNPRLLEHGRSATAPE
jgi:hypothetical protein